MTELSGSDASTRSVGETGGGGDDGWMVGGRRGSATGKQKKKEKCIDEESVR